MVADDGVLLMAFSAAEVSRLTGLSVDALHRWSKSGLFVPEHKDFGLYSFRDVVGLRTMVRLKDGGLSVQRLRKAGELLRTYHAAPWASLRFYTSGKTLYFGDPKTGEVFSTIPLGQKALTINLDLQPIMLDVAGDVRRSRERSSEDFGQLDQKRGVCGGAMRVKGTRIPTSVIWEWHESGASADEILQQYPTLTKLDIAAAIEHERKLSRRRKAG